MKHFYILALLFISTYLSAQCQDYNCETSIFLPISDINGVNNLPGNKCFVNYSSVTHAVPNTINFNNWTKMTFAAEGSGGINVQQTLNINSGQEVYLKGNITLSQMNMSAGADSSIVYVEDSSEIFVTSIQFANNTHNYVFLGRGVVFTMAGETWSSGETYSPINNPTNIVKFVSCYPFIPLAEGILGFNVRDNVFSWSIDDEYLTVQKVEGNQIIDLYTSFDKRDSYTFKESGYYQGTTSSSRTNVFYIELKETKQDNKIYDIYGRLVLNPEPNVPYIQNNKKIIIIQ